LKTQEGIEHWQGLKTLLVTTDRHLEDPVGGMAQSGVAGVTQEQERVVNDMRGRRIERYVS
jgi:hypothetical protein